MRDVTITQCTRRGLIPSAPYCKFTYRFVYLPFPRRIDVLVILQSFLQCSITRSSKWFMLNLKRTVWMKHSSILNVRLRVVAAAPTTRMFVSLPISLVYPTKGLAVLWTVCWKLVQTTFHIKISNNSSYPSPGWRIRSPGLKIPAQNTRFP